MGDICERSMCTVLPHIGTAAPEDSTVRNQRLPSMSHSALVPAKKIAQLVEQGQTIVIHEGYALDLGQWLNNHPGGRLAILHMVGRDATDEINM